MRHFLILIALVAVMLAVGFGMLTANLGRGRLIDEPLPAPIVSATQTSPMAVASMSGTRMLVNDPELGQLRAENEALKARVLRLEQRQPRTRGELAAIVGVKESEVDRLLDRSELLPDAKMLNEAIRISGAQSVWKALQVESTLYHQFAEFKAKNPVSEDRITWHQTCWVPFLERSITAVCDQLYQLSLPSSVVEPFRLKLLEGI